MKSLIYIILGSIMIGSITSCADEKPITDYRGKVKFETIAVSNKLGGRISDIYVNEGQSVSKGDTLAIINIPEVNAKMMQAEGAISAAKGQLQMALKGATIDQLGQIDSKIDAANAQFQYAQDSYSRLHEMFKDSLISLQQLDEVKMKLDMAKAQVSALESKRKEISRSARSEQIDQANGQLSRAKGAREEVLSAANEKVMIAPADMSIETISLQPGELLSPGYALFNGYKKGSVFFRFTIPESKIYNFKVGQEVLLENPFIDQETKAKVVAIKQLAQYADITSTSPVYELSESIYELKLVPLAEVDDRSFFLNATILIKQ